MDRSENWILEREILLSQPTAERWEVELERLFQGKREHLVREVESAADYVESVMLSSVDYASSRTYFREALHRVVESWQPIESDEEGTSTFHMLDLIGSFTPGPGAAKVLDFLIHHADFGSGRQVAQSYNLIYKSFRSLHGYYPGPPDEWQFAPFSAYVGLLNNALEDERFVGYALTRLVTVGVLSLEQRIVREKISETPGVLEHLISYWLALNNVVAVSAALTKLYNHCLFLDESFPESSFLAAFESALRVNRAKFDLNESLDPVINHVDKRFLLDLRQLEHSALATFKIRYLEPLVSDSGKVALAVLKMLSLGLIGGGDKEVRSALYTFPDCVLPALTDHALGLEVPADQARFFSLIFFHCLALDESAGKAGFTDLFEKVLFDRGLTLDFAAQGEEIEVHVEHGTDSHVPISLVMREGDVAAWQMLKNRAVRNSVALAERG